jgi:tetratricopeptide (TPR) repeat protein
MASKRPLHALAAALLVIASQALAAENSSAIYRQAIRAASAGRIDEAIPLFRKVIQLSPRSTLGHYGLGRSLLYRGETVQDAIKHLSLAASLDRKNAKAYFYLGIAYLFDEKYIPAIHAFSDAYRADSTMIEALYNTGVAYDLMRDYKKASLYFEKYLSRKYGEELDILF